MSLRPKWQNIGTRNWPLLRDELLAHLPTFPSVGATPDPGVEGLLDVAALEVTDKRAARLPDVDGLRRNVIWEAVFLFHKCLHALHAAQRLGHAGMHSWAMFDGYHAAYLGAKGVMSILGVSLPNYKGGQLLVDLFPPAETKARRTGKQQPTGEFLALRLAQIDQKYVWEAFQRTVRMTQHGSWDENTKKALLDVEYHEFAPPRNHFLYKSHHWLFDDLTSDETEIGFAQRLEKDLSADKDGFLLRLSFCVFRIFEQLMGDLASQSGTVKSQLDGSRASIIANSPEFEGYRQFLVAPAA